MLESYSPELRRLELFAEMEDEHFDALMRASYVQNFPPQIELITEGEPSDFLHVVVSGSVDLFSTWNGRETVMAGRSTGVDLHSGRDDQGCALPDVGPDA